MDEGGSRDSGGNCGRWLDLRIIGSDAGGAVLSIDWLSPAGARQFEEAFASIEPWRTHESMADKLAAHLSAVEAGARRFAIRKNDQLAGAFCWWCNWLCGPYLQLPGVLAAVQNRGIGVCVLRWIETEAVSDGGRHVGIMVSEFNGGARKLYERNGYHVVAAAPDVVRDGFAELLMR